MCRPAFPPPVLANNTAATPGALFMALVMSETGASWRLIASFPYESEAVGAVGRSRSLWPDGAEPVAELCRRSSRRTELPRAGGVRLPVIYAMATDTLTANDTFRYTEGRSCIYLATTASRVLLLLYTVRQWIHAN